MSSWRICSGSCTAALFVVLMQLTAAAAADTPELLDRVVATVDGEAILWSELNLRLEIELRQQRRGLYIAPEEVSQRRRSTLQSMIDEHILVSKARRDSVQVEPSRVDEVFNAEFNRIESSMEPKEFADMLKRSGLSERVLKNTIRKRVRRQLLSQQFISELAYRQFITRKDVEAYRQAHRDTLPAKVSLSQIHLRVRPEAETLSRARDKIDAIRARLDGGDAFAEVARSHSEDPGTAPDGGELGCFGPGTLMREFEVATRGLKPGEVSEPVMTKLGFHLILLREKRQGETCASHILVRARSTRMDAEAALARLAALRNRALEGEDFAELARDYSEDEEGARRGGLWDYFPKEAIPPFLDPIVSSMGLGDVSEPFMLEDGAHILKINDDYATLEGFVREELVSRLMSDLIEAHRQRIHVESRLDAEFLWKWGDGPS